MKKLFAIIFLSVVIFPSVVFAQSILTPYFGPIVSCVGGEPITGDDGKTIPTCTSLCDIFATIQNALRLGVTIAIYIMVPIYVAFSAYKIAVSGVSGDKIAEARKILREVVIGIVLIIASFAIVNTFMNGISSAFGVTGEGSSWLKIGCKRPTCGGNTEGTCPDAAQSCVGAGTAQNPYKCQ